MSVSIVAKQGAHRRPENRNLLDTKLKITPEPFAQAYCVARVGASPGVEVRGPEVGGQCLNIDERAPSSLIVDEGAR
jgi:hypothetical protein